MEAKIGTHLKNGHLNSKRIATGFKYCVCREKVTVKDKPPTPLTKLLKGFRRLVSEHWAAPEKNIATIIRFWSHLNLAKIKHVRLINWFLFSSEIYNELFNEKTHFR